MGRSGEERQREKRRDRKREKEKEHRTEVALQIGGGYNDSQFFLTWPEVSGVFINTCFYA